MLNGTAAPYVEVYVPEMVKTISMSIFCVVTVVGVVGNLLTILSIILNKKLKSIPNVYICNLAIADLIVCSLIAPFSAYIFTVKPESVSPQVCTFIGALTSALLGKTIFGLTAIAVNRFILLVKGGKFYNRAYTRQSVVVSVCLLWLLPILIILPALFGFGQFGYNSMMGTCIFISHDLTTYIYVQTILHGVCVGPCVFVTTLCYSCIIVHFRKMQRRIRESVYRPAISDGGANMKTQGAAEVSGGSLPDENKAYEDEASSSGPSNNNSASHGRIRKRTKASRRVVMNLCTVFTVFLLCWLPIVSIFTIDIHNTLPAAVSHIFYAIAVSNSCLNVFIYAGMNSAFRKSYINILTFRFDRINSSF